MIKDQKRSFIAVIATAMLAIVALRASIGGEASVADQYRWMNAQQLTAELRTGRLTAHELIRQSEELIQKDDRDANGFGAVIRLTERGRSGIVQAAQASPLNGLPVIVKDNIAIRGEPTTAGSMALAKNIALADSTAVERIRQAGAVILARANLSEWANFRDFKSTSGWSSVGGQTRNAYNRRRNPCGSSAGSAVAVARGYAPFALGTETCGSIICPAAANGVVGIKPSRGLVSNDGVVPISKTFDTIGPIARRVADAALLLSVMMEPTHESLSKRIRSAGSRPRSLNGLTLGVVQNLGGGHVGTTRAFGQFTTRLRRRGVRLVDVNLPHMDAIPMLFSVVVLHEFKRDLNDYLASRGVTGQVRSLQDVLRFNGRNADTVMPHFNQQRLILAAQTPPLDRTKYNRALKQVLQLAGPEGIDRVMDAHNLDALIAPSNRPAWRIDYLQGDAAPVSSAVSAAVSGYPAMTVPMAQRDGLPMGVTVWGRRMADDRVIAIGAALERMTGGFKRPPSP